MRRLLLCFTLALLAASLQAKDAPAVAADPVLEKRVLDLSSELRCLVCQNQTIADSHAELAIDLKNQVREKLSEGMSDKDVIAFMVQRYGDFVLYRPPVKSTTWLLWFGPFLLLFGGLVVLGLKLARRRTPPETLPASDLQRVSALLGATTDTKETS